MKDIQTIAGQISNIERVKSSKNGNPRWRFQISSGQGKDYQSMTVYTEPDSILGYEMGNYKSGQHVKADIGWHYGTLTLSDIR